MTVRTLLHVMGLGKGSPLRALGRGILLAALVGVISGVAAIAFSALSSLVLHYGLGGLAGYLPGGPANEIDLWGTDSTAGLAMRLLPWMLVLLPAVGGLISGVLVTGFAPDAEGHGTDAAIRAYHHQRGLIPVRVPIVKLFASVFTLGLGGSGGREGPIAQIGAGFGSFLATRLGLPDGERRILMAAGLGAGVGAIFHAPLAGAIFAIEVLYREPDFEAEALIPAFIATTVAYATFSLAYGLGGFHPLFEVGIDMASTQPLNLIPPLAVLAVAMSILALLYVRVFWGIESVFRRMPLPRWLKPAVGGLLTGAVGLTFYYSVARMGPTAQHDVLSVLSFGYGFLQKVLAGQLVPDIGPALTLLLIVGLGKILTTALTIGSGGSGGVFGPSMVIGGSMGAVVGVVMNHFAPGLVATDDIVIFAILGMASFFAAAANTPVSTLIMVSELTNSYALLLPSMWVCALAYLMSRNWNLYVEQVGSRLDSPAHRGDFIVDILKGLSVSEAITDAHCRFITASFDTPLTDLSRMITSTLQSSFPVVDEQGRYQGLFSLNDIRAFLYESGLGPLAVAADLADTRVEPLTLSMDLSDAISRFAKGQFDELPVVDEMDPTKVVAMLRRQDVITVYDKRLLEMRSE